MADTPPDPATAEAAQAGIAVSDEPIGSPWWHGQLSDAERARVRNELAVKLTGAWAFQFGIMMTLSVIVAVMGLSANSAAVVIGAMLLAPLMQPVLATAALIATGYFIRAAKSFGIVLVAVAGSIALSYVLAAWFMSGDLPREVTSRTAPDIRDLVVALGAGAAGAYATVRADASSSLPGVAVAVALVPPLGTVGIALEAGRFTFARGAMLLFTTNLAAIVLAGILVFVATGMVTPRRRARTFGRSVAVVALVLAAVVVVSLPLYRASTSAVEASDRQIEARTAVDSWLGIVQTTRPPTVTFNKSRILVEIRSFELPPDATSLIEDLQNRFGTDTNVSIEWDRVEQATTTTSPPVTTVVSDEERFVTEVATVVDAWLADGAPESGRRRDALTVIDGIVRVDASGVGEAPSVADLIDRLDGAFEQVLEVQLTWLKREDVLAAVPEPTPDELLIQRIATAADDWARGRDVTIIAVSLTDGIAEIQVAGAAVPDATDLVAAASVEDGVDDVVVLFTQRIDISTTTTTTTTTTTSTTTTTTTVPPTSTTSP